MDDLKRAQRQRRETVEALATGKPTLKVRLGELVGVTPAPKSSSFGFGEHNEPSTQEQWERETERVAARTRSLERIAEEQRRKHDLKCHGIHLHISTAPPAWLYSEPPLCLHCACEYANKKRLTKAQQQEFRQRIERATPEVLDLLTSLIDVEAANA